jgi:hypothetical protein
MYGELASWWPLLSAPSDYAEEAAFSVNVEHDRHVEGLFPRARWPRALAAVGYLPSVVLLEHSELDQPIDVFVGRRP